MKDNNAERFPIVDEEGKVIGAATRGECHNGSRLLHPVVHLHVFNSRGEVFLQKRPEWKDIQPGKWDTAVGGHIDEGAPTTVPSIPLPKNSTVAASGRSTKSVPPSDSRSSPPTSKANSSGSSCKHEVPFNGL